MYSPDPSDITFPASGSRLLSESPILHHTGPGGDDLSISELSLSDRTPIFDKPFTLLAPSEPGPSTPTHSSIQEHPDDTIDAEGNDEEYDSSDDDEHTEQDRRQASKKREDKLQSDIFILKQLNASFAAFNEALQDTGSANQRIALQLEQTDALLNKYIDILSKSEEFSRLIFDERWQGAEEDEAIIERERVAQLEKARREAEERALAAQLERERREREERERIEQEEKERLERERKERMASRGAVRGVRGTRASMRGAVRGTTRTAPAGTAPARGRSAGTSAIQTSSSSIPSKLPTTSTRGLSRRT